MKKKLTIEGFLNSLIKAIEKMNNKDLDRIMNLQDPRLKKSILKLKTDKSYRQKMKKRYGLD